MKKRFLLLMTLLCLASCGTKKPPVIPPAPKDQQIPFRIDVNENEKAVILNRNSAPVAINATQLRSDLITTGDRLNPSDMGDYFQLAHETGFKYLDLTFTWKSLETNEDEYDFSYIDAYMNLAKENDIRLNIIWYGSFVDGNSLTANIPEYIVNDKTTYEKTLLCYEAAMFGVCYFINWENTNLLNRESKAIKALFDHVGEWNIDNDYYDPIMMFQIGQGLDRLPRWRTTSFHYQQELPSEKAWSMINTYITHMSRACKSSLYSPLTRVEFCEQDAVNDYVRNIKDIESVDFVTPTYLHTLAKTKTGINAFSSEYGDVMPIVNSENFSNDSSARIALATYALGGSGYCSHNLSSPLSYPMESIGPNGGFLYRRYDKNGATLDEKFVDTFFRGKAIKQVNEIINTAYVPILKAKKSTFGLLGYDNQIDFNTPSKQFMNNGIMFEYSNPDVNQGICIYLDGYIFVYSTIESTIRFNNLTLQFSQIGTFDIDGFFNSKERVELNAENIFTLNAKTLYRFKVGSIAELPDMETLESLGYKSLQNSIRA